ncbi:hypothetical protein ACGFNX_40240 [Streptomyces sp. NPDC048723]|uniref:hypothetical protein n=1 Tax=Streptomyces sp. NPDC048723 TaxID=3365589 RepID=UPI00371E9928
MTEQQSRRLFSSSKRDGMGGDEADARIIFVDTEAFNATHAGQIKIKHVENGYVAYAKGYTNMHLVLYEQRLAFRKGSPSIKLHVGGKFGDSGGRRRCMSGRAGAGMAKVPFEVMRATRELMLRVICPTGVPEQDRFDALA